MSNRIGRRWMTALVLVVGVLNVASDGTPARAVGLCEGAGCRPSSGSYPVVGTEAKVTTTRWTGSGRLPGNSNRPSASFSFAFTPVYSWPCDPPVRALLRETNPFIPPLHWRGSMTIRWADLADRSVVRWDEVRLVPSPNGGQLPTPWTGRGVVTSGPLVGLVAEFQWVFAGIDFCPGGRTSRFTGTIDFVRHGT